MKTIGFIGLGKMASAIIAGLDRTHYNILASGRDFAKTQKQAAALNITAIAQHSELVAQSDLIILAVKPQVLPSVMPEILSNLTENKTLVSIAAGFTLGDLQALTQRENTAIVRVMPNINAQIQQSTSAVVRNAQVSDADFALVKDIFTQVGSVHEVAEKDFSAFTALAGSSPAYIYMFIDALARAGVLHGLPKATATDIVAETVAASAQMLLQSQENPWSLVDKVSSPGGTTVAGVVSLEQNRFAASVIDAITATINKEKSLGK